MKFLSFKIMIFKEINRDRYVYSRDNVDDKTVGDKCGCHEFPILVRWCWTPSEFCQHPKIVTNILSPTSLLPHYLASYNTTTKSA